MSDKRPATDGDRLPWLGPMPDRAAAPGPRAAVRGLTMLVVVLTLALIGSLSLLLLRERDAPTAPPPSATQPTNSPAATVNLPVAAVVPVPTPAPPVKVAEAPPPVAREAAPAKQVRPEPTKSVKKARSVRRQAAPRRAAQPQVRVHRNQHTWPTATRGRVMQLGAFNSAGQAVIAWRASVRDYPYLGTLPRKIVRIRVGPRRTLYYRLQVAAPSTRHAEPICRVVRATRRACLIR